VRTQQGFSYRTKVRRCVDPCTGATIGWHVDREYGHGRPYSHHFSKLLKDAGEPAFDRLSFYDETRFEGDTFEADVLIPSAELGYQDTFKSGSRQTLTFSIVGEEPAVEDFRIPLRRNPWRKQSLLVEGLLEVLYGLKEEPNTREPEEVALRRMLKQWRRENPGFIWAYGGSRKHRVHMYECGHERLRASVYYMVKETGEEMEAIFGYLWDERRWVLRYTTPVVREEYEEIDYGDADIPDEADA
jgi:hypothetical protein